MRAAVAAERAKLRTLPAAVLTVPGTIVVGAVIAAALAALAADEGWGVPGATVALYAVPYVQAGVILLGILPVSQEYAGRQIGTTLSATPGRMRVVVAKTAAAATTLSATAVLTVAAAWGAAEVVLRLSGAGAAAAPADLARLGGAAVYLALIGLLAHAATLLVRHLIPALTGMLLLVYVLPPVLAGLGEHARWLPERAGAQLYAPSDAMLTAGTGALVLAGWIAAVLTAGAVRFHRQDA